MKNDDKLPQLLSAVIGLAEAYDVPMSAERQEIYVHALSDLDIDQVKAAIWQIIRERTFADNLPTLV